MASVLQVATIKDQGGNNNAIEIANTSANVTINNLAGGTIGSNVTFPAGHIINTIQKTIAPGSDTTTVSEDANISGDKSSFQQQITITSGNKVYIQMMAVMSVTRTASDAGAGLGIRVDQGSGLADLWIAPLSDYITVGGSSEYYNRYFLHTINFLHTPSNTTPTYQMYISIYGGTSKIRSASSGTYPSTIILQEIQS